MEQKEYRVVVKDNENQCTWNGISVFYSLHVAETAFNELSKIVNMELKIQHRAYTIPDWEDVK